MCDTTAFVLSNGNEEMVMESIEKLSVEGDEVQISNIFGERKTIKGSVKEIDFNTNRLLIVT